MSEPASDNQSNAPGTIITIVQRVVTMLIGLSLIAVVTPLSQFLTMNTVSLDIEVGSPIGWVVGVMFTIVLFALPFRMLAKRLDRANLVLLYAMLTVAVPVMNLGLVRQIYMAMMSVPSEYVFNGTDTYRTMYNSQSDKWFPKIPTREGMSWAKANHMITLLNDTRSNEVSEQARRQLQGFFKKYKGQATPEELAEIRFSITQLNVDDAKIVQDSIQEDKSGELKKLMDAESLTEFLDAQYLSAISASKAAAERLSTSLGQYDPMDIMGLPVIRLTFTSDQERKYTRALNNLSTDQDRAAKFKSDHDANMAALKEQVQVAGSDQKLALWMSLQQDIVLLSKKDRQDTIKTLSDQYLQQIKEGDDATFNDQRNTYMLLLTKSGRRKLLSMKPRKEADGIPNQALSPMQGKNGLADIRDEYLGQPDDKDAAQPGMIDKVGGLSQAMRDTATGHVPWNVWLRPIFMWSGLSLAIFLFLMCVAEYLRRKWVERENLAFPQVEIIDHFLRHNAELETADDPLFPKRRKFLPFNGLFAVGIIVGVSFISFDAGFHYNMIEFDSSAAFDVSGNVLQTGIFKQMNTIFFVLSPIILGIAFLVSLELSFSIFILFFLYQIIVLLVGEAAGPIKDPLYAGWAAGRTYPFPMEQMLGAMTMFTMLLLWKSIRSGAGDASIINKNGTFVPRWLFWPGIIILPIIMMVLFLTMGMTWSMIAFMAFVGIFFMIQNIAIARARAETGLPTHHVSYEFTKLPLVFGLTGFIGAANYTRYLSVAFLPITLLGRSLGLHLENMELARRNRLRYGTLALGSVMAFIVAITVGMFSFLILSYLFGEVMYSYAGGDRVQGPASSDIGKYSMYVAHFLGENGLDQWGGARAVRIYFILIGAGVYLALHLLRGRFLKFPLHPLGYMIVLLSVYYGWISPYYKQSTVDSANEASVIWGSVLVAWFIKKLIIKYGGMNAYKQAKPFFIGLVVGSLLAVFFWNMTDLWVSLLELGNTSSKSEFLKTIPYSPRLY